MSKQQLITPASAPTQGALVVLRPPDWRLELDGQLMAQQARLISSMMLSEDEGDLESYAEAAQRAVAHLRESLGSYERQLLLRLADQAECFRSRYNDSWSGSTECSTDRKMLTHSAATLVILNEIPPDVVVDTAKRVTMEDLEELVESKDKAPPPFTFRDGEYDQMALAVRYYQSVGVTSGGRFVIDNQIVTGSPEQQQQKMCARIRLTLTHCVVRDWRRRERVLVDNRMLREVLSVLRQTSAVVPESELLRTQQIQLTLSASTASEEEEFFAARLRLDEHSYVVKRTLFEEWKQWCKERGLPTGEDEQFFQKLKAWSGDKVDLNKRRRIGRGKPKRVVLGLALIP